MPVEANWCTQERMALSKRTVSPSSTSRPSQPNKSRHSTARARASSGPATCCWRSGILGPCFGDREARNQVIELGQQRLVPGARIRLELLRVKRQVKQKGLNLLPAELLPEGTIAHFVDIIGVEG